MLCYIHIVIYYMNCFLFPLYNILYTTLIQATNSTCASLSIYSVH